MNKQILQVAKTISQKLVDQGAEAVVLFGSWARGDAYEESDIDIHAIGKGPRYRLERCQSFLVSSSWATLKQHRQSFKSPGKVGAVIPAWRNAIMILDPRGIAAGLKQAAGQWKWDNLGKRADRWVAEELTGYAEEVHRLVGSLQLGRRNAASIQRSLLAIHMAPIMAVHCRILYETENRLWDLVSATMGSDWTRLQNSALGEDNESFETMCKASLQLYALTARKISCLLSQEQYEVVAHACEIAGQSLIDADRLKPN